MTTLTQPADQVSLESPEARFVAAALRLAGEGRYRDASLRDIAHAAGAPVSALFAVAATRSDLTDRVSDALDRAVFDAVETADREDRDTALHDRLFEAVMARVEAMEPHRFALLAMLEAEGPGRARMVRRLVATARAVLTAAGVGAEGPRGAVRLVAMTRVWRRVLEVWRDDEGALNRTMAEIDKRLKDMEARLDRIRVGL